MSNLIQAELDIVEDHVLKCLFRDSQNPQINSTIKSFCVMSGKHHINIINDAITQFETAIRPFLKENGYVDGEKFSALLAMKFNKQIPMNDFRLVEVTRAIEPWLLRFGTLLQ